MVRQSKAAEATVKQEAFARCVLDGHSATEAYKRVYDADGMKDVSIRVEASRLLKNPKVSGIIEAARTEVMRGLVFSLTDAKNRLDRANQAALDAIEAGDASPATVKLFIDSLQELRNVSNDLIKRETSRYHIPDDASLGDFDDFFNDKNPDIENREILPLDSIVIGGGGSVEG